MTSLCFLQYAGVAASVSRSGLNGWLRRVEEVIGILVFALEALPLTGRSLDARLGAHQS